VVVGPVFALSLCHCVIMPRALELPDDGQATGGGVQPGAPTFDGRHRAHSWIAARAREKKKFLRFEVAGSASKGEGDPFEPQ